MGPILWLPSMLTAVLYKLVLPTVFWTVFGLSTAAESVLDIVPAGAESIVLMNRLSFDKCRSTVFILLIIVFHMDNQYYLVKYLQNKT